MSRPPANKPAKPCERCGRMIQWRAKWARNWEQVRYCSDACRRHRLDADDAALEAMILQLLAQRSAAATICPSEVARALHPANWQQWMERTRQAARRLLARGLVDITQKGQRVDPSTARGPIRIRRHT